MSPTLTAAFESTTIPEAILIDPGLGNIVATHLARRTCLLIDVSVAIEPRASSDQPRVPDILEHDVSARFGPAPSSATRQRPG